MTKEQFLTHFFTTLNSQDIDYFVYGEYEALPHDTGGSDIDIMVSREDRQKALDYIRELADANGIIVSSFYRSTTSSFLRLLARDWGVQIDFFGGGNFVWNSCVYYPTEFVRKDIILHNGIKVLDINTGYYVDFFKETIHIARVKDKYIKGFLAEYRRNPQRQKEIKLIFGESVARVIEKNLTEDKLARAVPELSAMMRQAIAKGMLLDNIKLEISKLARLRRQPGYVIAVLGTDGSGKSTIINAITPWLNESFHHGVVYNHLRPNAIPDLGVVLGKKPKGEKVTVVSDPHKLKPSGFLGSLVRWGYYMIDYTFGYLKVVWPKKATKSKVFIFDRYYYDYYVDQRRARISLPRWILRFGELFVPKPDLTLCLGGDPKKIYARKPETSLEEVERQVKVLKDFCAHRKNAVWIDTTLPIEESCLDARKAILEMMTPRFKNVKLR